VVSESFCGILEASRFLLSNSRGNRVLKYGVGELGRLRHE